FSLYATFIRGADLCLFRLRLLLLFSGLLEAVPVGLGAVTLGPITFSLHGLLLRLVLCVLGLHGIYVGALARLFSDYSGERTRRWLTRFSYTRSVVLSALVVASGIGLGIPLVVRYIQSGFRLSA